MDEIIKFLCNKTDYDSYSKMKKRIILYDIAFAAYTILSKQYDYSEYPNDYFVALLSLTYLNLQFSHGEMHTRDIKEIRTLYDEFLKEYNKLNKTFDLNNPVQINTMFNYLVYKGYLSKNKRMQFSDEKTTDIIGLLGADIFSGEGVCRHVSAMLTDILNSNDIESHQLCVYIKNPNLKFKLMTEQIKSRQELIIMAQEYATDEKEYKFLTKTIDELIYGKGLCIDFDINEKDEKSIFKRLYGNHAITYATYKKKNYFLDPTQNRIYRQKENNWTKIYDKRSILQIKALASFSLNDITNFLKIYKNLLSNNYNVTNNEINAMVKETKKTCENNIDIFEQFYHQNKGLYEEIHEKMKKL